MDRKHKSAVERDHAERQFKLLPQSGTSAKWADVPDSLVLSLVRDYTDSGDAILFGKSQDQSVLAVRVYRNGKGYSVYARGLEGVGEAIERLYRLHPPLNQKDARASVLPLAVQGYSNLDLPFHPSFTVQQLNKQRLDAQRKAKEWNDLVLSFPPAKDRVALV